MSAKPKLNNVFDAIAYYPIRNQVAIFLLIDYVNQLENQVFTYEKSRTYVSQLDNLSAYLRNDAPTETIAATVRSLKRTSVTIYNKQMKITESIISAFRGDGLPTKEDITNATYFKLWTDCTAKILERFHNMTEEDINALLKAEPITPGGPAVLFSKLIAIAREISKELEDELEQQTRMLMEM